MIELATHIQSQVAVGKTRVEIIWDADGVTGKHNGFRSGVLILAEAVVRKGEIKRGFEDQVFVVPEARCIVALTHE